VYLACIFLVFVVKYPLFTLPLCGMAPKKNHHILFSIYNIKMLSPRFSSIFGVLFFGILLFWGLCQAKDFGFTLDEPINYRNGLISEKFVLKRLAPDTYERLMQTDTTFEQTADLINYYDNDYGVAFDLPVQFALRSLDITDSKERYIFKHRCNFTLFWVSACFLFAILRKRWAESEWWAFGGTLMYLAHPRILPDAFYNPKDLPLLSFFVIAIYFQMQYFQKSTWQRALPFAITSALAIDVRILGIMLPATTGLLTLISVYQTEGLSSQFLKKIPKAFWIYVASLIGFIILFMPILWHKPLYFMDIFEHMSHFRWNSLVLFRGEQIIATDLPRSYLPIWIFISSPLAYSLAGFIGICSIIGFILKNLKLNRVIFNSAAELFDTLFLAHFIIPLGMIIGLHSVLYDGWRQVYFVYGAGILLSIRGITSIANALQAKLFVQHISAKNKIISLFLIAIITHTTYIVWEYYPYSNVYFNCMVSDAPHHYELDYWGTGNVQALKYIAANDNSDSIFIESARGFAYSSLYLLPIEDRKRFFSVHHKKHKPHYYITQYRFAKYDTAPDSLANSTYDDFFTIQRNSMKITSVYKKKQ
jgi:hypothetical protein